MTHQRPLDAINRTATSSGAGYVKTDLGIKTTNEETRNLVSGTYGQFIKNNIQAFWYALGCEPNVTGALNNIMYSGNASFERDGRTYFANTEVGNMRPYDLDGQPTGGCFTMTAIG